MLSAFTRLLFIASAVIFSFVLVVFGLRTLGSQQTFGDYDHPLLKMSKWVIAVGGETSQAPPLSLTALKAAHKLSPEIFLGLKIRKTTDGQWAAYEANKLEELTTGTGFVQQFSLAEVTKLHYKNKPEDSVLSLEDIFKQLPNSLFYIEVLYPGLTADDPLFTLVKNYKLEERVVLTTPFINSSKTLRDTGANWLTGASTSEVSKAALMTSLYLETIMDLPADVFVTPKYSPRLFQELLRRKRIAILVTDDPKQLPDSTSSNQPTGVMTTRPTLFESSAAK